MTITRFEDIVAWQKARLLTREIYRASEHGKFARDFRFAGQIQAAVVSIMSNVAEGFERNSNAEFHLFLGYAKASSAEVRSDLYVALDLGYIDDATFARLYALADEIARMLESLRRKVAARRSATKTKAQA